MEVDSLKVEKLKLAAHQMSFPLLQEYEFRRDREDTNPQLTAVLRPTVNLRPYQQRALSKMCLGPFFRVHVYQCMIVSLLYGLGCRLECILGLCPKKSQNRFSADGVAKSGIVVLPCGAGKTLVGIAACCRVGRRALVLTTTAVAVDQWRRQIQFLVRASPSFCCDLACLVA